MGRSVAYRVQRCPVKGRLHRLDGCVVPNLDGHVRGQRHLGQADGARVGVLAGADDLEDGHHGEGHVGRAVVGSVGAEAQVHVEEGCRVALEPAGLQVQLRRRLWAISFGLWLWACRRLEGREVVSSAVAQAGGRMRGKEGSWGSVGEEGERRGGSVGRTVLARSPFLSLPSISAHALAPVGECEAEVYSQGYIHCMPYGKVSLVIKLSPLHPGYVMTVCASTNPSSARHGAISRLEKRIVDVCASR